MKAEEIRKKGRFRLLPEDKDLGWTPFAWLIYLALFVAYLPFVAGNVSDWILSLGGVAVFLVLYFTGYWLRDRRILWVIAGITLIGVVLAPGNPGASVFFIYAAAFAGYAGPPRLSVTVIAVVAAVLGVESWLLGLSPAFWLPGMIFTIVIGGVNSHFGEAARTRARLHRAEEEIESLAQLAERERIARDLHDLLGHTLSLITLKSELAGKLVAKDPERATNEIRDIENISRKALAEVRQTVAGYRASGLEAELANAKIATSAAGITMKTNMGGVILGPNESTLLAYVLREAMTNILRHSGAQECSVVLEKTAKNIRLMIADDGQGRGGEIEGQGLGGMRRRLEAAGGTLSITDDDGLHLVAEIQESRAQPAGEDVFAGLPEGVSP